MEPRVLEGGPDLTASPRELGGKAANLVRLQQLGADVPPWLVLTASPAEAELPDGLDEQLRAALERTGLHERRLAVRSSAVGEDARGASFAGQFETVLDVPGWEMGPLRAAIDRVRASARAERVAAYAGTTAAPPMAVIIQALVDATAAGVAFTADPVTDDRDVSVVSAVHGLGEALVSGEVDADTFRLSGGGDEEGEGEGALRVVERTLVDPDRGAPAISDAEAEEVTRVARDLARQLGHPQDVEWALEGEPPRRRLVILQTRPITTLTAAARQVAGAGADLPKGERRVWDNSNIVESYAGVTTPLTFSFARGVYEDVYRQFCGVMGVEAPLIERNRAVFAAMIGLVRGRVYYNLLNWYRVLSLLPGYAFNRAFMERMMGVREKLAEPPDPPLVAGRWQDLGRLVRMVGRMTRASRGLRRSVPAFHVRVDRALAPVADADLTTWSADRLAALYRQLEEELLRHWQPPLVNDFFAMIWFGILGRLVERWLPDQPPTLINDLLAGGGGMISTEPARQLMALAGRVADEPALERLFQQDDEAVLATLRQPDPEAPATILDFATDFSAYLRRFGDRCANELKLETVTLSEEPGFLIGTIRSYVRQGATDPDASREREARVRAEAEARVDGQLRGVRRRLFGSVLRRARTRIRDRENLRFERTRVFGVVRRILVGLGHALHREGRLDQPRDVFWLTIEELFGWAEGTGVSTDLRALVDARRREFHEYQEGPPPPERFETWGPPSEAELAAPGLEPEEGDLTGTGCCPGVVRARVRLVRDPREAGDLDGRILVAERTDPGWTLLFPSASGILVQRGSLLSHSAIVAREMGIPCVVSIPGLMISLRDNELVEMDGTTGVVRRLEAD